ncbi:MAG: bifunctional metallophosphatase/5'-nucleotidase [Deltaproteobacteria bacterium]|nr:bifunctional metallophosphatase/5'-nucleotidase [Deltaproteobacteria bacterium]
MLRFSIVAAISAACIQTADSVDTSHPVRFTWLHTSDIHSRLIPYDFIPAAADENLGLWEENAPFGGAARFAYLLKRERARSQRVLHLDSGDCYQGAPIFNYKLGEVEMKFMTQLKPDAVVIGNHEFDDGVFSYARQLELWGRYSNLAANYIFPDARNPNNHALGRLSKPFDIYNLDGVTVGVIGMANLSSLNSIGEGGNSLQLVPMEQNTVLQHYVDYLDPLVDLVVVVSHLGLHEDEEAVRGYEHTVNKMCTYGIGDVRPCALGPNWEIIEEFPDGRMRVFIPGVRNVDIIFGGHLHIVLNPPKVIDDPNGRPTLIVHSGAFAKYVGRLDTMIEDEIGEDGQKHGKRIIGHKYQPLPVDNRLSGLEDADMARLFEPYSYQMNRAFDLKRVIAYAPRNINRRGTGESGDSPLGNMVAEAMRRRRRVEAEFAITNTLGVRDNIYAGPITVEAMFNVLPFENTVTVMQLSGFDVQDLFDYATSRSASRGCQPQAQIAGITYTQNCAQVLENDRTGDYKHPAQNIRINGDPADKRGCGDPANLAGGCLDLNATYKMATNNYIAAGGSGFQVLKRNTQKVDTGVSLRDAVVDYMQGGLELPGGGFIKNFPTCREYEAQNNICALSDEGSQKLCADLKLYADLPCVEGRQDGRIKQQFVLGVDAGAVGPSDGRTDGDQVGGNGN